MGDHASVVLADWIRGYVAAAARDENVDHFVARVDGSILREIPEIARDPVLTADLHASTRAQFQVFLTLLERERAELLLPPQAVDLARSIARRQLELGVLLKVYRIAAAAVWDFFTQVAADVPAEGPDRTEVLIHLWGHGGTWINEAVEELIVVFSAERESAVHGTLARRTDTTHALLRGDQIPLDDATELLGHPVRAAQTALVVWTASTDSSDALLGLTTAADALASATDAHLLTVPTARGEIWCWLSSVEGVDPEAVISAADAPDVAAGVRIAIGSRGEGLDGFRRSHREAVAAQRHAVASPDQGRATCYEHVELACLVAGQEEGVRTLIRRELRALADPEPAMGRIRDTVGIYLDLGASVERTAAALFVHKNTIRYRLAQAEELIGHPLSQRRTELALALRCLPRYL